MKTTYGFEIEPMKEYYTAYGNLTQIVFAELTTISTWSRFWRTLAAASLTSAELLTSHLYAKAVPSLLAICLAVSCTAFYNMTQQRNILL